MPSPHPPSAGDDPALAFDSAFASCEAALGLTLTLHDLTALFRHPDGGGPLLHPDRYVHRHPVCQAVHDGRCLSHCLQWANAEATRRAAPFAHRCWKGVQELVVPIARDGAHLATLFAGVFRSPDHPDAPPVDGLDAEAVAAYRALPESTPSRLEALGPLLDTFAQGLLLRLDRLHQPAAEDATREARIRRFLREHAHEDVRLADLAATLHLSPSRTSHVVRAAFGASFRSLLHRERMRRARALLLASDEPVAEIGRRTGLPNPYHFSRAFTATYGLPPSRFRQRHRLQA